MAKRKATKTKETTPPPAMTSDEATAEAIKLKLVELHKLVGSTTDHSLFASIVNKKGMHHIMAGTATNQIGGAVLGIVRLVQSFLRSEEDNDNPLLAALKQSIVNAQQAHVNDKDKN